MAEKTIQIADKPTLDSIVSELKNTSYGLNAIYNRANAAYSNASSANTTAAYLNRTKATNNLRTMKNVVFDDYYSYVPENSGYYALARDECADTNVILSVSGSGILHSAYLWGSGYSRGLLVIRIDGVVINFPSDDNSGYTMGMYNPDIVSGGSESPKKMCHFSKGTPTTGAIKAIPGGLRFNSSLKIQAATEYSGTAYLNRAYELI